MYIICPKLCEHLTIMHMCFLTILFRMQSHISLCSNLYSYGKAFHIIFECSFWDLLILPQEHKKSGTGVQQGGLPQSKCCSSSQRCSVLLRSRLCVGHIGVPFSSFKPCPDGPLLCWNNFEPQQTKNP